MFKSQANSKMWCSNSLFCHACLSCNRTLTAVGEYIHVYRTICDNIGMDLTSQTNVCWECLALLKKVQTFKRKVENARKILDLSANKENVLENLSNLTLSSIETTTFDLPVLDEEENESGYFMGTSNISEPSSGKDFSTRDLVEDTNNIVNFEDSLCEIMFKIENVRSCCEILDGKPVLDWSISSSEVADKVEPVGSPADEDESRHRRWKRAVLLVFKRICSHPHAVHFMRPVTDAIAPHYSSIVRRPTDLTAIRQRIKDGVIRTTSEFTCALLLMFSNALMYNSSHHKIYHMTLEFREEALRELSLLIEALATAEWLASPPAPAAPPATSAAPLHFTRRASVRERPKHEFMKTPAPRRGRRHSLIEPQNPKLKEQLSNRSTLYGRPTDHLSQERSLDQIKAPASLRGRRATVYEPTIEPPPKKLRTRRASIFEPPGQHTLANNRSDSPVIVPTVYRPSKKRVTLDKTKATPLRGRRATLCEPSMQSPKPVELPSAATRSSDRIKAGPLRGRRATVYEATMQAPKLMQRLSTKKGTSDQKKAAPLRGRRATAYEASMQPIQLMEHSYAINLISGQSEAALWEGRRSTAYEASTQAPKTVDRTKKPKPSDRIKAAPLRTRRATVFASKQNIQPVEPSKKRPKWDWPSLEDEYLIAKKFKHVVAVL